MGCSLSKLKSPPPKKGILGDTSDEPEVYSIPNRPTPHKSHWRRFTIDNPTDVKKNSHSSPKSLQDDAVTTKPPNIIIMAGRSNSFGGVTSLKLHRPSNFGIDKIAEEAMNLASPMDESTPSMNLQCLAACIPKRLVLQAIRTIQKDLPTSNKKTDQKDDASSALNTIELNEGNYLTPTRSRRVPAESLCSSFDCALLFVDISGFTGSMEKFAAHGDRGIELFWKAISGYFGSLLREIYSRGGDVECFAGDAMMVSFGAEDVATLPIGKLILQRHLTQVGPNCSLAEAKLSVATMVAVDAAAAMLKTLSPYSSFDKDFWGPGEHMELNLTLHGSIGAGKLTSLEIAQAKQDLKNPAKKWHYVCGPVIGQLARAHAISEANDCVLSKQAGKSACAEKWGLPLGNGRYRMKGPNYFPKPLLCDDISMVDNEIDRSISDVIEDRGILDTEPSSYNLIAKLMPSASLFWGGGSTYEPILKGIWPKYEVASLLCDFRSQDIDKLEEELLAYVPEPLAKRFRQKLVTQDLALPQPEKKALDYNGSSNRVPSLSWLGELRPAAVAFVNFEIGNINSSRRGRTSGRGGSSAFKSTSESFMDSDSPPGEAECRTYLEPLNNSIFDSGEGNFDSDGPPQNRKIKGISEFSEERRGMSAQRLHKVFDIPRACLAAAEAVLEQNGHVNKILMDEKGLSLIYAFGTPGCSFEDNSIRALRVGCTILSRLGIRSGAGRQTPESRRLKGARVGSGCNVSIGVATGQVCAALLGLSTVRCEYALVGDTVNLAARLAGHAAKNGCGMLACPTTIAPLMENRGGHDVINGDEFAISTKGYIRPKGKTADVEIYDVKPAVSREQARTIDTVPFSPSMGPSTEVMSPMRVRTQNILLGRDKELNIIQKCIQNTIQGIGGGVVIIQGEAGVGKSGLLRKARRNLINQSFVRRRASFDPQPQMVDFSPLLGSQPDYQDIFGTMPPLVESRSRWSLERGSKRMSMGLGAPLVVQVRCMAMDYFQPLFILSVIVQQILAELIRPDADGYYSVEALALELTPSTMKLIPLLRRLRVSLKGQGTSLAGFIHLPASEVGKLIVTLCAALVEAASNKFKGTVVFIDDLHQCDGGSLAAMVDLLEGTYASKPISGSPPPLNLSLILSTRSEEYYPQYLHEAYHKLCGLANKSVLNLESLNDYHANGLACVAFNTFGLGPNLSNTVTKICKGNPLFIKEVCRFLMSQGQIEITQVNKADLGFVSDGNHHMQIAFSSGVKRNLSNGVDLGLLASSQRKPDHRGSLNSTGSGNSRSSNRGSTNSRSNPHNRNLRNIFSQSKASNAENVTSWDVGSSSDADAENEADDCLHDAEDREAMELEQHDFFESNNHQHRFAPYSTQSDKLILVATLKPPPSKSGENKDNNLVKLPESLSSIATASIDRLDQDLGLIVKVASVFNGPFTAIMLDGLKVLQRLATPCLQELCSKRLLESAHSASGIRYTFMHELVRVTAYNMLLHQNRRQLHYRIAELLGKIPSDEPSQHHLFLVQHWLKVVENPPSTDEIGEYGGKTGWARVLMKALRCVIIAVKEQLSFGSYRESEVHFLRGQKILEYLNEDGPGGEERDVLEFELDLMGLQIFELTSGPGSSQIPTLFQRAIAISCKENIKQSNLLSPFEVLQAKLFKANYMLYQEHTLRNDEINATENVLQPLYLEMSGTDVESVLLRLEVVAILASDALQKGALKTFDTFQSDISVWEQHNKPELLSLTIHDPIAIALGGQMINKLMDINYSDYVAARTAFSKYMQNSSVRPYHLWTTMSLVMLVSCVTRELRGLPDMLAWINRSVQERFRGTGLPTHRMRLMEILSQVYSMVHNPSGESIPSLINQMHFDWTNEWFPEGSGTSISQAHFTSSWPTINPIQKSNHIDRSPTSISIGQGVPDSFRDMALKLSEEAETIVVSHPSPIMCATGYQIGILTDNDTLMDRSLKLWEETGIGMSWTTKNLQSITTSFLFYARAEFRLRNIRKELEAQWISEDIHIPSSASSVASIVPDVNIPDQPLNDLGTKLRHNTLWKEGAAALDGSKTPLSVDVDSTRGHGDSRKRVSLFRRLQKRPELPTTPTFNTEIAYSRDTSSPARAIESEKMQHRERRKQQLKDRISSVLPDLSMAIRNARGHKHYLLQIQAQMLLAEVHLFQGNSKGALLLLEPAIQARQRCPKSEMKSIITQSNWVETPPLSTLDAAEILWVRGKALARESGEGWNIRTIPNHFKGPHSIFTGRSRSRQGRRSTSRPRSRVSFFRRSSYYSDRGEDRGGMLNNNLGWGRGWGRRMSLIMFGGTGRGDERGRSEQRSGTEQGRRPSNPEYSVPNQGTLEARDARNNRWISGKLL